MTRILWLISASLFACGLGVVVFRRQLLIMLFGLEIMISAALIPLVRESAFLSDSQGLAAALIILCVAAAEAVVGLSLILHLRRNKINPEIESLMELKG